MNKIKSKGFTIIELLIVVAIIGILASIAVPSYSSYLVNARRVDGQVALRNAAQVMERCRTQTFTYVGCNASSPTSSPDGYYTLGYGTPTATTFTITATPTAGKPQANDTKCTTLTLNQTGLTGYTPTTTAADICW